MIEVIRNDKENDKTQFIGYIVDSCIAIVTFLIGLRAS